MFRKIKALIIAVVLNSGFVFGAGLTIAYAAPANSGTTTNVACGSQGSLVSTCTQITNADEQVENTIKRGIKIFQLVVGIISVAMLIFGGLKYITSGGESAGITSAKNTILYAVIGLVVVGLSQVIVQFALNRVNDAPNAL